MSEQITTEPSCDGASPNRAMDQSSLQAIATISTAKASGYLQQLCKHFAHKIPTEFTPEAGWIQFDFGKGDLSANAEALTIIACSESFEDLDRLKKVLASHLVRFAFREDLDINWSK